MIERTATRSAITPPPVQAVEFGQPDDWVRIRIGARGMIWSLSWLAVIGGTALSTVAVATAASGPMGFLAALPPAALIAWVLTGIWRKRIGPRELYFDRIGIHDTTTGGAPLRWSEIARLDVIERPPGGLWVSPSAAYLVARLTPEARDRYKAGAFAGLFDWAKAEELRDGVILHATEALYLPVPFEYLVLNLRARGAPIRPHAPMFDAFEYDARWLSPVDAAQLIETRLGPRARPFANHNLDIARSRGSKSAIAHWDAVLAELRRMSGLVSADE
jgi:hypothetical protein